jgi:hypothetical protein
MESIDFLKNMFVDMEKKIENLSLLTIKLKKNKEGDIDISYTSSTSQNKKEPIKKVPPKKGKSILKEKKSTKWNQ